MAMAPEMRRPLRRSQTEQQLSPPPAAAAARTHQRRNSLDYQQQMEGRYRSESEYDGEENEEYASEHLPADEEEMIEGDDGELLSEYPTETETESAYFGGSQRTNLHPGHGPNRSQEDDDAYLMVNAPGSRRAQL